MKSNINDLSTFADLKTALLAEGVSRTSVDTLNSALTRGLILKSADDLALLSIPAAEVKLVAAAVSFGASQPEPQDFRTIQYTFHPLPSPPETDTSAERDFVGFQLVFTYTNKKQYSIEESYPITDSHVVYVDVDLNDVLDRSEIIYRVKSPRGEFARIGLAAAAGLPSQTTLDTTKAELKNAEIAVVVDAPEAAAIGSDPQSYRVRGRLLASDSSDHLEGYQIVILATADPAPDVQLLPVAYAETETGGYFITSYLEFPSLRDLVQVKRAIAVVSKGKVRLELPIRLVTTKRTVATPDGETVVTETSIPERVILVMDVPEDDHGHVDGKDDPCGCADLNFLEKKVFEEFSYYSVVRTTEPAIIADVLEDQKDIDLGEVYGEPARGKVVPLDVFKRFHALKSRQVPVEMARFTSAAEAAGSSLIRFNAPAAALDAAATATAAPTRRTFTEFDSRLLDGLIADHRAEETIRPTPPRVNRGRAQLGPLNQIDWDKATIYQAASVAHGHLLHFKQQWIPDGYSIGDLLYSLPLAPGQEKQIAVLDWERRESAANSQTLDYEESLNNTLIRDRDISEVVHATLNESLRGSSSASTAGVGAGLGGAAMGIVKGISFGALLGVSGGGSSSGSTASQNSSRDSSANSLQAIRDRTSQAASAVRSQRSTVIQTVSQGERVQATSESVANYNHCHAVTIQYFEVVRHFAVHHRFAGAQECLFIPLQMSNFETEKALRWRNVLEGCLLRQDLRRGFEALERIQNERESLTENYYDSIGYPRTNWAEQSVRFVQGELFLEFYFFNTKDAVDDSLIAFFKKFFRVDLNEYRDRKISDAELARIVGPRTVEHLLNALVVETDGGQSLDLDVTLVTPFRQNARLQLTLSSRNPTAIPRASIRGVKIRFDEAKVRADDATDIAQFRDLYMKVLVRSGSLRYRTDNFAGTLFSGRIDNDLFVGTDTVFLPTPLTSEELRNPRGEDLDLANKLIHHLNENLEYYHTCMWFLMSDERRFMLLDGIVAPGKANGRSVASVVENRIIGIAGNSLIMPVAPGNQLDPTIDDTVDLHAKYYVESNDPTRVSLPTKGVYAESVLGKCNSCEEKDEGRFWRWEESPIPNSPTTPISPVSLDTRRAEPGDLRPNPLPAPVVSIQNAPALPDPTALSTALNLVGKGDAFRDVTGLTENQKNALATLQKSLDTAQAFGNEAASLAKTAGMLDLIRNARNQGALSNEEARDKSGKVIDHGIKSQTNPEHAQFENGMRLIDDLEKQGILKPEDATEARKKVQAAFHDQSDVLAKDESSFMSSLSSGEDVTYSKKTPDGTELNISKHQPGSDLVDFVKKNATPAWFGPTPAPSPSALTVSGPTRMEWFGVAPPDGTVATRLRDEYNSRIDAAVFTGATGVVSGAGVLLMGATDFTVNAARVRTRAIVHDMASMVSNASGRSDVAAAIEFVSASVIREAAEQLKGYMGLNSANAMGDERRSPVGVSYAGKRAGIILAWLQLACEEAAADEAERVENLKMTVELLTTFAGKLIELAGVESPIPIGDILDHVAKVFVLDPMDDDFKNFQKALERFQDSFRQFAAKALYELLRNLYPSIVNLVETVNQVDLFAGNVLQGWSQERAFLEKSP